MNNIIRKNPIVRIVIPFIIGIIIAYNFYFQVSLWLAAGSIALLLLILFNSSKTLVSSFKYRWLNGLLILVVWFFIGGAVLIIYNIPECKYENDITEKIYYGKIVNMPEDAKTFRKMEVKLQACKYSDTIQEQDEKVILYIPKDSLSDKLNYGDFIFFKTKLHLITNKGNPDEFDYATFMKRKQIWRSGFLYGDSWKASGRNEASIILKTAYKARNSLLSILKENGISGKEFAVVSALTLGYKAELDEPTKSAFVASGAMHIMAVSGLHVGIIQLILNYILFFFKRFKRGKLIKMLIIILCLWAYALITGLSPSVSRAALMFSFIQVGISLKRDISIFNIVAIAALVILLFNPNQLFEVGFQFSFLAVSGIIYLHNKIYKLLSFKYWILDKAWAITVASFAAQLSLGILSIYYFNQFPNYFLLSNLIIIPLTFLIITFTVGLFVFTFTVFSSIFAFILKYLAWFLIRFVSFIQELPFSQSTGIYLNIPEVIIWYSLIILIIALFVRKKAVYLLLAQSLLIVLLSKSFVSYVSVKDTAEITVFNLNKSIGIFVSNTNQSCLICDSVLANDSISRGFYFKKFLSHRNSYNSPVISISDTLRHGKNKNIFYKDVINSGSKNIMVLHDEHYKNKTGNKLQVDYMLITNNVNYSIDELLSLFKFEKLIIAADNTYLNINKWQKECKKKGIPFYNIRESGAFSCK